MVTKREVSLLILLIQEETGELSETTEKHILKYTSKFQRITLL